MDAFSYLATFLSIILGLGVTKILGGAADLIRLRTKIQFFWPGALWMLLVFLFQIQLWWSLFSLRNVHDWTFAGFILVAMRPVALFLASALVTPVFSESGSADMREAFFRESRGLFACLSAGLIANLAAPLVVAELSQRLPDVLAQSIFVGFSIVGFLSRNETIHKVIVVSALVQYGIYVGALFLNLT
jgi:hypothetical protein